MELEFPTIDIEIFLQNLCLNAFYNVHHDVCIEKSKLNLIRQNMLLGQCLLGYSMALSNAKL